MPENIAYTLIAARIAELAPELQGDLIAAIAMWQEAWAHGDPTTVWPHNASVESITLRAERLNELAARLAAATGAIATG